VSGIHTLQLQQRKSNLSNVEQLAQHWIATEEHLVSEQCLWAELAAERRLACLVMFYRIHYNLVAITMPLESKCPHQHSELKIPWLTLFQPHTVITFRTHSSQELFVNGISCHNLLFYSVLLRHSGVHCHLSNMDPGTPLHYCALSGSRVPSRRSQKFASVVTICTDTDFILVKLSTPLTVHPNSSARAFNLLKFALNPEEEEEGMLH